VDVRVADAAVRDGQKHIVSTRFAALEREGGDRGGGALGGVAFGREHGKILGLKAES
jgi:hypothetical protein